MEGCRFLGRAFVEIGSGPDVRAYLRERVFYMSARQEPEGMSAMSNMFLLEPEYQYHAKRARDELKPVRYRKWRRRLHGGGATDEKNWIN